MKWLKQKLFDWLKESCCEHDYSLYRSVSMVDEYKEVIGEYNIYLCSKCLKTKKVRLWRASQ
jgi:hypothetical protein